MDRRIFALAALAFASMAAVAADVAPAQAQQAMYPIRADDDGSLVPNHQVSAQVRDSIEKMPGVVVVGNPQGRVTVAEFYDLNCPFCRAASQGMAALIKSSPDVKLVLVPFPVLSVQSVQAGRIELAVAKLATPAQFYEFHTKIYAGRGVIDGVRAFEVARSLGLDLEKVLEVANADEITEMMKTHLRMADELGIQATPGVVVDNVVINGYPGAKALAKAVAAVKRCGKVVCKA